MAFPSVTGYVQSIWQTMYGTLTYVAANSTAGNTKATELIARAASQTMRNALASIDAYNFVSAMSQAYANLEAVLTIPLANITPGQITLISNRILAVREASIGASALYAAPLLPAQTLPNGNPAVISPAYLEWQMGFEGEAYPTGMLGPTLLQYAQAELQAWQTVQKILPLQPVAYQGATYDAVVLMTQACQEVVNDLSVMPIATTSELSTLWNTMVTMPTLTRYALATAIDPTTDAGQQTAVIRYLALICYNQFNTLLTNLRDTLSSTVHLATVRVGDTLMDIAARELGNFERWNDIATLNGLVYPFITPTVTPTTTAPGQQIFIPSEAVTVAPSIVPLYSINYLGVDFYYGPLNSPMLPWTGDFETIAGYQNLALSLGRRLQTTVGTLIYHPEFGSRIPPEVGAVQTAATAGYVGAYAVSAVQADPRVAQVPRCNVNLVPGSYAIEVTMTVIPNGLGAASLTLNEVLQPQQ